MLGAWTARTRGRADARTRGRARTLTRPRSRGLYKPQGQFVSIPDIFGVLVGWMLK